MPPIPFPPLAQFAMELSLIPMFEEPRASGDLTEHGYSIALAQVMVRKMVCLAVIELEKGRHTRVQAEA